MGALKLENEFIIEEFFENFQSKHTRISYKNDILQFFEFVKERNNKFKKFSDISRLHVIQYRNFLHEFGGKDGGASAPKTINRKISALSSYFDFLVEKNFANFNPVSSVKRPRHEVKGPTMALTRDQVKELIESVDLQKKCGLFHRALLITFFTTGLRKSEILNLKRKHYKNAGSKKYLEFVGKGQKLGQKLLHPWCIEAIDDYLDWMKSEKREHHKEDWLFQPTRNPRNPGQLNRPLNPKTMNQIIESYAKKIGLPMNISPHSARATFITELLSLGVDIYSVAQEVNHSSVKTTQEYDKRRKHWNDSPVKKLDFS